MSCFYRARSAAARVAHVEAVSGLRERPLRGRRKQELAPELHLGPTSGLTTAPVRNENNRRSLPSKGLTDKEGRSSVTTGLTTSGEVVKPRSDFSSAARRPQREPLAPEPAREP